MWPSKKVLSFIKDMQVNECLWNIQSEQYRNRKAKSIAIDCLAKKYEISASEVEKKISNLKCQFRREHKKSVNLKRSASYSRRAAWFGYEALSFLLPIIEKDKVQADKLSNDVDAFSTKAMYGENLYMSATPKNSRLLFPETKINSARKSTPNDFGQKETIKCIKTETGSERDEFLVYGEHIANKLRSSGRSHKEIAIAQNHIDGICFNLIMGVYREDSNRHSVSQQGQTST